MKTILTLLLALVTSIGFSQNIWIADNRPTAPTGAHVFADINSAVAAASPGDIIHVIPSSTAYSDAIISKDSLTVFGIGFNPQKDQPNKVSIANITIADNIFGTRISGLVITAALNIGQGGAGSNMGNIFIENCEVARIDGDVCCNTGTKSNIVIRNCLIGEQATSGDYVLHLRGTYVSATSVVITNNVIQGTSSTTNGGYPSIAVRDAIIKNNIFLGNATNDYAFYVTTSTISNNVFYGRTAMPNGTIGNSSNNTFNNNVTFGSADDALPIGVSGNTGDSALVRTDPLFVNLPLVDDWTFNYDPSPDVGSPLLSAGNDGTDIGVTGSTIPFSSTGTPLPVIKVLRAPEVIKQGTNLNATIEAVGN
ncbi:MAG: hypothetical protein ACFHWX_20900 [Bacteroidota bacterium]